MFELGWFGRTTFASGWVLVFAALLGLGIGASAQQPGCGISKPTSGAHNVSLTPALLLSRYDFESSGIEPAWIPGSNSIVFSLGSDTGSGSTIDVLDIGTGGCRVIAHGQSPLPSPDGEHVAYYLPQGAMLQLYVAGIDGSNPKKISTETGGLGAVVGNLSDYAKALAWSPDSKRIAFGYQQKALNLMHAHTGPAAPNQTTVHVVGAATDRPPDGIIAIADLSSGAIQRLTSGKYVPEYLHWFGNTIAFTVVHYGMDYGDGKVWGQIRTIDLRTGIQTVVVANRGVQDLSLSVSPNRASIAFPDDPNNVYYPENLNISTVSIGSKRIVRWTTNATFPHYISGHEAWAPDGAAIYFIGKKDAFSHLFRVTATGTIEQIDRDPADLARFAVSSDGKMLVWISNDAYGQERIITARADGSGERTIAELRPEVNALRLGSTSVVQWRSSDGLIISGLVLLPPGYDPHKKYPLLVDIHGGPTGGVYLSGSIINRNPLEWQMWAARGFVVLATDYRSSEVPGWVAYLRGVRSGTTQERNFDDIMSGVDYVVDHYGIDRQRMAVVGHSYGSVETNWIITHTHRFKVAISYEGVADWYYAWSSVFRVGGNPAETWEFGGTPWEVPDRYLDASAGMHVKGVTTPTLFVNGDYGTGHARYDTEFMYGALLNQHVPTSLIFYGDEGHVVSSPANVRDLLARSIAWIDKYL